MVHLRQHQQKKNTLTFNNMRKLLLFISVIAFSSCSKDEGGNCAKCYLTNGQLWSYVCEDELDNQTIQEYLDYWNNAPDLNCHLSD